MISNKKKTRGRGEHLNEFVFRSTWKVREKNFSKKGISILIAIRRLRKEKEKYRKAATLYPLLRKLGEGRAERVQKLTTNRGCRF